jgi:hypothetical protein
MTTFRRTASIVDLSVISNQEEVAALFSRTKSDTAPTLLTDLTPAMSLPLSMRVVTPSTGLGGCDPPCCPPCMPGCMSSAVSHMDGPALGLFKWGNAGEKGEKSE